MNLGNGKGPKHTGPWFQHHTPSLIRQPETSNSQIQPLDRNADHPPHQNPNLSGRFTHACSRNHPTAKLLMAVTKSEPPTSAHHPIAISKHADLSPSEKLKIPPREHEQFDSTLIAARHNPSESSGIPLNQIPIPQSACPSTSTHVSNETTHQKTLGLHGLRKTDTKTQSPTSNEKYP